MIVRFGDRVRLRMVIGNFLSNCLHCVFLSLLAIKFTPHSGSIIVKKKRLNSIHEKMFVIKEAKNKDVLKTDRETYHRVIETIGDKYHMILVSKTLYQNQDFEDWTSWIQLSVSDTGIGISEQDLKTLFHP